jgi:predicted RNase H-like nuclease (RuvC/YqgF family)
MITPEQLIYELQKQVDRLTEELDQAQRDIRDFEIAAIEWRDGYEDMEKDYKRKLGNAEQVISQLEEDLKELSSTEEYKE